MKTPQQIKDEFNRRGETFADWAKSNGFPPYLVSQVITGKNAASRGQGHRIAVLLGLKDGVIAEG